MVLKALESLMVDDSRRIKFWFNQIFITENVKKKIKMRNGRFLKSKSKTFNNIETIATATESNKNKQVYPHDNSPLKTKSIFKNAAIFS